MQNIRVIHSSGVFGSAGNEIVVGVDELRRVRHAHLHSDLVRTAHPTSK